jgi:hypothetical protein
VGRLAAAGRRRRTPAATSCGGGLAEELRLRDSSHYFDSGLVTEKEIKEGNAAMELRRSAGDRGRRATARRGGEAPTSNHVRGRMENRGEKGRRGSSPQGGAPAAAERRGGSCNGNLAAAAMAAAARASRARGGGCELDGSEGTGQRFIGQPQALACGPGAPRGGERPRRSRTRMRVRAGLTLEVGNDPDGQAPPVSLRRGRAEGVGALGWAGGGAGLLGRLGRAEEREERKRVSWAGPQGGKREREKEKERVGRAQIEKEGEKELHSNAFEFKFEI